MAFLETGTARAAIGGAMDENAATYRPVGISPRTQIAPGSGTAAFGSYHNGVMTVQLSVGGTDDPAFVCLVNSIFARNTRISRTGKGLGYSDR
jgi:hypothetical protein